ncbi:hypothetical protein CALVIDRAFT_529803 [Calocera viscosa TUFC12733]|uniref:C2 NT-type domain-containing protein n=1 Tax=Calocera viscosa (strain TUFC12733) TaxID=1330018 RepID=A0A167IVW4_CALVF|nr:hypothetical protein CALVIDRAFT_529803 [Calocera viscosa TUFC12733]
MSLSTEPSMDQEPARLKYVFSGATVQGLPSRGLLKSEGKYYLKISVDREDGWSTRELRTKESALVWDATVDRHEFEQVATSMLQVTLCKHHSRRPMEEIGTAQLPISTWLTTGAPLVRTGTSKDGHVVYVTLNLSTAEKDAPRSTNDTAIPQPVQQVEAAASGLPPLPAIDTVTRARDAKDQALEDAMNRASEWEPLLTGLDAFARVTESMAEVNPFSKMASKVLSAASKVLSREDGG